MGAAIGLSSGGLAAALTDRYRYDAYGSLYSEDALATTADPAASFLYTGHRYDSDTGLYHLPARLSSAL